MSVNGVTSTANAADTYSIYNQTAKAAAKTETAKAESNNSGVIYESSASTETSGKKIYKPNAALVAKLKADADARTSQLKSLVEQMISKQGQAIGKADSIWSFLAKGSYSVDPSVQAQAQKDISEDGYWGVTQTSDRIVDFAAALTGNDPDKIEEMRSAFKKGFEQATRTWGGKLPDISQKTYQAVMDKFDKLAEDSRNQ